MRLIYYAGKFFHNRMCNLQKRNPFPKFNPHQQEKQARRGLTPPKHWSYKGVFLYGAGGEKRAFSIPKGDRMRSGIKREGISRMVKKTFENHISSGVKHGDQQVISTSCVPHPIKDQL